MKNLNKLIAIALAAAVVGCSTASRDIMPAYVSPAIYSNYDCDQLRLELIRVSVEVNSMSGKLDKNKENDTMTTTAGIILFWPALFFLGGTKEQEARYAQLKGEYIALEQATIQRKCGFLSGGATR
jgi:hypothetical protein